MNKLYWLDGDEIRERDATEDELVEARRAAKEDMEKNSWAMRSCWNCNSAHSSLLKEPNDFVFRCVVGCGNWYYKGMDITQRDGESGDE
jgi:hypothetical protein